MRLKSGIINDELLATRAEPPLGDEIGSSREGRPIHAHRFGSGDVGISLIGGCHADEPVGPWLLDRLVAYLAHLELQNPKASPLRRFSWWIVPHANPDGDARNAEWTAPLAERLAAGGGAASGAGALSGAGATPGAGAPPSAEAPSSADAASSAEVHADARSYAAHVVRELPGDDIEFGFPKSNRDEGARPENRAIAEWWRTRSAPFDLHVSLHGMGAARGPWYLIEPAWRDRCGPLIDACRQAVAEMGYALHDDARTGEKGFDRIAEGFSTRPDSVAMADFFEARGEPEMAARFRPSSMETIRAKGGDPLTLVTEMPLFIALSRPPGISAAEAIASGDVTPMPIVHQWRLQWHFIDAGIQLVTAAK